MVPISPGKTNQKFRDNVLQILEITLNSNRGHAKYTIRMLERSHKSPIRDQAEKLADHLKKTNENVGDHVKNKPECCRLEIRYKHNGNGKKSCTKSLRILEIKQTEYLRWLEPNHII